MQQDNNEVTLVRNYRPLIAVALVLSIGLGLTVLAVHRNEAAISLFAGRQFTQHFERLSASVQSQMDSPSPALRGLSGLFAANGHMSHKPFQAWVQAQMLPSNYPGLIGLGWLERVPRSALDTFVRNERAEQGASFQVIPRGEADPLSILKAIEPRAANVALWGQDASDNTALMEAANRAVAQGELVLTRGSGGPSGSAWGNDFYYLLPMYRGDKSPQTPAERESALAGLWVARLAIDPLFKSVLPDADGVLDFELLDTQGLGWSSLVFSSSSAPASSTERWQARDFSKRLFKAQTTLLIAGRRFALNAGSSAAFESRREHTVSTVLGTAGAVLSTLLAIVTWLLLQGGHRTTVLRQDKSNELARLTRIVEGTSHVVFTGDADGDIVWVNEAFTRLTGVSSSQAMGRQFGDLVRLDSAGETNANLLRQALNSRKNLRIQLKLKGQDGEMRWLDVDLRNEQDALDGHAGYTIIAADITAQRQANDHAASALRESEALMAAIDQHSIVSITDYRGVITYVNDMFSQISGYSREELIGKNHRIVKSAHQDDAFWESMWKTISSGYTWRATVCNRAKDGQLYWVDSVISPFFDDAGNIEKYVSIRSDVTPARKAQAELANEREHLNAILEGTDAGTWEWEVPTGKVKVNSRWAEMVGYTLADLGTVTIDTWGGLCHPDDLQLAKELLTKHFDGTLKSYTCEVRMRHRDGHWVWVMASGKVNAWVTAGQPRWVSGIHLDITVQKSLQSELHQNNQVMQSILENIPVALSVFDKDLQLIARNDKFLQLLDFPARLFEGQNTSFESLIRFNASRGEYGSGDVEQAIQFIIERARNTVPHQFERVRPTGEALEVRGAPMPGGGFITTYADISARKLAEEEIKRSTGLLQSVLDAASEVSVISMGLDGIITLFNKGAERLFGCRAEDVVAKETPAIFFLATEMEARSSAMSAQLGRKVAGLDVLIDESVLGKRVEWTYVHRNGHHFFAALVVTAMTDSMGKRIGYLGVSHDVTAEKDNEHALHMAVDLAEQAALSKGQFLANMSHEIRTPMNAILGMLKLLQNTPLNTRQQDYATKTESAARSLLGLLNDILDFSKAEAGKMQLDPQPFSIDILMRDLSVILSANTGARDIEVLFDIDVRLPGTLIGDAMRLQQVLINLGGNAIKFTEHGEVLVSVRQMDHSEHDVTVRIAVRDSGIGIDPANQQHIFSGFSQAEASTTRRFGGSGLGLSICRRLVDLMGGELMLDSALGKGSTFYFDVLLPIADSPPVQVTAPIDVLIVDDTPLALEVIRAMAQGLGWHVTTAVSGTDALAQIQTRADAKQPGFSAVFLDWKMPVMDGWEAAQRIQQMPLSPAPYRIMVTGHSREMLAGRSEQDKDVLDGFLVKPVTASMLRDAVLEAAENRLHPDRKKLNEPAIRKRRLSGMRLLVVEDNLINQQVAKELLGAEGALVTLAGNGQLGVDAVASAKPPFDAVLMDLQMPVMDGYTAAVSIRHDLGMHTLPIIAMTANAMASDRESCLAAGMNDHIGKPFDLPQLMALLLRHTGFSARTTTEPEPAAPEKSEPADKTGLIESPEVAAALERLGGNVELYQQVLQAFLVEIAAVPGQLKNMVAESDAAGAGRLLHTIKGLSLTVGATALSIACRDAETALKAASQDTPPATLQTLAEITPSVIEGVTLAITTMEAVQRSLVSPSAGGPELAHLELDQATLLERLQQLQLLLRSSDMHAQEVFAQMSVSPRQRSGSAWVGLQSAMMVFDYPQALRHCEALIHNLRQTT
jgi:PAS domain S-box-containing protein